MDFPLRFLDSYAAVRIVSFLHHQHVEMMPIDALWDCEIQVSKNEAPPSTTLLQNPNALNALHFTWAHSAVRKLRGETGLTGSPGEKTIEDNIFSKLNTKWNRNFKLKSIETNCISTSRQFRNDIVTIVISRKNLAMPCSRSVPRHLWGSSPAGQEPDPRHLSLARLARPGVQESPASGFNSSNWDIEVTQLLWTFWNQGRVKRRVM